MTVQNNLLGKIACKNICNDMPYLQEVWDDECLCHPHWSRITVIWYLSTSDTNNIGWLHNSKVISNMDVMKNAKLEPSLSTNISLILFISIIDVNMLGWLYSDMVYLQYGCKTIQSAQYLIDLLSFFLLINQTIPEIQLFWHLTLKNQNSKSWVRAKVEVK